MGTIGEVIKALREARGWNQTELAQRAGLPASHINQIERGKKKNPTQHTLEALAGAFDMSVAQFMASIGVSKEQPPTQFDDVISTAQARQLLQLWAQVSDADRIGFLAQLRALAELRRQIEEAENSQPGEVEPIEYLAGGQTNGQVIGLK
jgi:transcriptional regulator with XRE-family HTH domain